MIISNRFRQIFPILGIFLQQVFAFLAIPTEDLLGPEVCPTRSYCVETNLCTNAYYTTKSGLPFYCGPNENIDSKICCIETEAVPIQNVLVPDKNEVRLDFPGDHHAQNLNSSMDDDEVDILSLPYVIDNYVDDAPIHSELVLPNPDDGLERSIGDLESMIEDAIEQELSSAQSATSSQNVRETGFRPMDGQPSQDQINQANLFNGPTRNSIHMPDPLQPTGNQLDSANVNKEHSSEQNFDAESRTFQNNPEIQKQKGFMCPCEKGEKGDPGPKGEPGEPGKIIYIPVFVNSVPPVGAAGANNNAAPLQFSSSQSSLNQPTQGQVPQHANPTVVPFHVPVNIPSNNHPLPVPMPTPTSIRPMAQQQQHPSSLQQHQVPTSQAQQHQPPPTTPLTPSNYNPVADDLQSRLTRHTYPNDQRFAHRRYQVAH